MAFFQEHFVGALIMGSAFGTAVGQSAFAPELDGSVLHFSRIFMAVTAVILIKFLFDAGAPRIRLGSLLQS